MTSEVEDSDSDEEEEDDEDKLERFLDRDTEIAEAIKEHVLPHAVRETAAWTGRAGVFARAPFPLWFSSSVALRLLLV